MALECPDTNLMHDIQDTLSGSGIGSTAITEPILESSDDQTVGTQGLPSTDPNLTLVNENETLAQSVATGSDEMDVDGNSMNTLK